MRRRARHLCDGSVDTARVPDDAEHIRPSTAGAAPALAGGAASPTVAAPRPAPIPIAAAPARRVVPSSIDANLRAVTLARGGQPLSGLYLQLTPMMANAATGRTSSDYFYFWPDGRVCEMLPPTGADPADYALMRQQKPRLCGRYVFTPNKLTIDVPDHVKAFDFAVSRFDGTNFVMDAYPTVKVKAYPAGATLSGTYKGTQFSPVYVRQTWAFRPDGAFTLDEVKPDGGPPRHLAGRYALHGNTLDLGSERHTIFPQSAAKAGRIEIDGHDMDPA